MSGLVGWLCVCVCVVVPHCMHVYVNVCYCMLVGWSVMSLYVRVTNDCMRVVMLLVS